MNEFIVFFDNYRKNNRANSLTLDIYYSNTLDWCITIGYIYGHPRHGKHIVRVQNCDKEYVFAKAQIEFKEWLLETQGGY